MPMYEQFFKLLCLQATGDGFIPPRMENFSESGLRSLLIKNIEKAGYTCPTPIQRHCIPTIMAGRDIMGCAQTGSGKTVSAPVARWNAYTKYGAGVS